MSRKLFAMMVVLCIGSFAGASVMTGQGNSIDIMLMAANMNSGGPMTGGVVGQFGGTVSGSDGWGIAAAQQAGIGLAAVNLMGPGMAGVGISVDATQMVASGGNTGMAGQNSDLGLMTLLAKEPGMGSTSATASAVVNQAEVVNTPAGTISNSNTSGASVIAAQGPCSTGVVETCVSVEGTQGTAFVNPCAPWIPSPPVCPPITPPCPSPCG